MEAPSHSIKPSIKDFLALGPGGKSSTEYKFVPVRSGLTSVGDPRITTFYYGAPRRSLSQSLLIGEQSLGQPKFALLPAVPTQALRQACNGLFSCDRFNSLTKRVACAAVVVPV